MWIYEYEREISKVLDTPDLFIEATAYWIAGCALSHRVFMYWPDPVTTNLYLVTVSPPGWYHKSSNLRIGLRVLQRLQIPTLSGTPSSESMAIECLELQKKGIHHSAMVYDEFRTFMNHLKKEYANAIMPFMAEKLQKGVPYSFSRKDGKDTIKKLTISGDFVLSFVASTTTTWLFDLIKTEGIESGFFARFVILEENKKSRRYRMPGRLPNQVIDALAAGLQSTVNIYQQPTEFTIDPSAIGLYEYTYDQIENASHQSMILAAFSSRLPLYMMKLAMIHAALSGRTSIVKDDISAASLLVMKSLQSYKRVIEYGLVDTKFSRDLAKVKEFIERKGGACNLRDLCMYLRMRRHEVEEIINHLVLTKTAQKFIGETSTSGGHKPIVVRLISRPPTDPNLTDAPDDAEMIMI